MIAHVQSRDITALPGVNFAFLAGSNEFKDEKCMYGNVSFRDTKIFFPPDFNIVNAAHLHEAVGRRLPLAGEDDANVHHHELIHGIDIAGKKVFFSHVSNNMNRKCNNLNNEHSLNRK